MNTAQRIHAEHNGNRQTERAEAQDLAVAIESSNCIDRVFVFYDGSRLQYTAEGFQVVAGV